MQQSSSLPERNSQIDEKPFLTTIEHLRYQLWLESNLNKLQIRLQDYLISVATTSGIATEAEIFQIVVNELHTALSDSLISFTQCIVAIALFEPQQIVGQISYISHSSSLTPSLEIIFQTEQRLTLRLNKSINLNDVQQMEMQKYQRAWYLFENPQGIKGWLIINTSNFSPDCKLLKDAFLPLKLQLITKAGENCRAALAQLLQIQSSQQHYQHLANFNQELERTNQLKNQFLANTSHEIRTPLSSIIGFTHLLLAQGYEPDKARHQEYLQIIQSSGKHLLGLINDILDLSKIEANQLEVQWEIIDIFTLCRNVLALVKEKAANKGLTLRLEIEADIKNIIADPLRLKQMLLNLLFNAIKFTIKGTVGLEISSQDRFLRFTVWDTGTGISCEDQSRLFRPYSQVVNPAAGRNEGTGLGLVVTQKLAEIHGGYLELESVVNQGSRFSILLPLKPTGKVLTAIETTAEYDLQVVSHPCADDSVTSSPVILLVEDDLPNGELIGIYLRRLGYQVTWVKNGAEMLNSLEEIEPTVILMDVSLPDANGLNLVQQLRENPKYQYIPIIAQTAMAMKGDRERCLAAGVNEYISKPIDLQLLASLVDKYSKFVYKGNAENP
ncbi:hybrid histidine kinase/response regulator HrmK [Dolichospermum sp. ST_con]|nr:hybrid histidine kinase/response regulator HrmK [Dolichospermum sp. ST_con]MDD1420462.1 hybrid histidine kinase/response regulator HrmK [Dolichospermum sp. ST_sed1]MDD1424107.1 hybrid histidine kinase/response regulator HrmK [Dolichospermum sp. ST_sed9]MDD1429859.1 hybrid histidine kinase/response regulator HrmK [Dolichospermum sp. ST_sed6]MDD1438010.1 hybrid histidine kinase/response regulator HrmK [Dolichospermum sp. ST_sed10]MDD1442761.1 hybrid histidine kinase/response regulator HrmK [D